MTRTATEDYSELATLHTNALAENAKLRAAVTAAEQVLGENLVWIADRADQLIRQKDPETLRRIQQLNDGWLALVKA